MSTMRVTRPRHLRCGHQILVIRWHLCFSNSLDYSYVSLVFDKRVLAHQDNATSSSLGTAHSGLLCRVVILALLF